MRYILLCIGVWLLPVLFSLLYAQQEEGIVEKTLTLEKRKVPLLEILEEIERQTAFTFAYEATLLEGLPPVTFTASALPIEEALAELFRTLPVMYRINGRMIILKKRPRQVVISGFVREAASSEPLIGASVYQVGKRKGVATNSYGFFSLSLNPGDIHLQISYIGFQPQQLSFPFMERDTLITIELENSASLKEVVVMADDRERQQVHTTRMGALEFDRQTIRQTPVMFGEADIVKTLQLTPGVTSGTDGFAGMYVRGGNSDENLFLIDGNPVYQISHVGGLFSAFNPDAIRNVEFYKAGFPSRYGGRLSSVVDVHTKEGNMKEFHGSATLGLIAGNLSLEGPIIKDRTSFALSFRRTWLDVITAPALAIANNRFLEKDGNRMHANYNFYDLNAVISHKFSERSRFYLSFYNGRDGLLGGSDEFNEDKEDTPFNQEQRARLHWGNLLASAAWTYVFSPKLFGKISGVFTQYRSSMERTFDEWYGHKDTEEYYQAYNESNSNTAILDVGARAAFDYLPRSDHHIRFGGDLLVHRFRPEYSQMKIKNLSQNDSLSVGTVFTDDLLWAREGAVFLEDDWTLSEPLRVNAGLRFSLFNVEGKTYTGIEPRLSMRWKLRDDLSLKASYSRMQQYIHLVSESYINLPTDAWMPVTRQLKPLESDQFSLGAYYTLNKTYDLSIEAYYKKLYNVLEYKEGYTYLPSFVSWEEKMTSGKGRSYGLELMARKSTGRTTGWIGYALSWSDRQFDDINNGHRFPAKYDSRHKLNIVAMHKLSDRVELSAAWSLSSGTYATLSLENYQSTLKKPGSPWVPDRDNGYLDIDYYGERNNYQFPTYHRLDLGINIYRPKKSGRMGIWNVSVYNAYCRRNPVAIYKSDKLVKDLNSQSGYGMDYKYVPVFKQASLWPIVPSVSYTYKF
ncbi:TonB-dependent receptor [Parabacteroides sp. PF5-6]|uniref:TonB-dependent receptor n=1 Tax=Parabacteroides sp. PF5-6 TaxID=1742403 RepID=UPI002405E263|nr:TonB-dependent receptor [Parabacteroides sp. PF5-6]MDF9829970.1 outer membrane receptor for ferrienterochelin and colicin [Parabacteroides sp. PF5-6]